jgi:hypothetical protein
MIRTGPSTIWFRSIQNGWQHSNAMMRVELLQLGDLAALRLAQLQLQHRGRRRP